MEKSVKRQERLQVAGGRKSEFLYLYGLKFSLPHNY